MIPHPPARAVAQELADMLERAGPMPLMPNNVCLDRVEVRRIVANLDAEPELSGFGRLDPAPDAGLLAAVRAVEKAVRRGHQVPFTDQVRLPRRRVERLAAALRTALDG